MGALQHGTIKHSRLGEVIGKNGFSRCLIRTVNSRCIAVDDIKFTHGNLLDCLSIEMKRLQRFLYILCIGKGFLIGLS